MELVKCDVNNKMGIDLQTLPPSFLTFIKHIVEEEKYTVFNLAVKEFETHGDNLFGKLYEIDINAETNDCKKQEHIFLKQRVDINNLSIVSVKSLYTREVFVYKELSKIFTSLQDQANVPKEDRYKMAKVYNGTDTKTIILENLTRRGFKTYGKKETIPLKFAELAVEELAKFHALTFAVESRMPEFYNDKIKVSNNAFNLNEEWKGLMRNICSHVANLFDGDIKDKFVKFLPIIFEKFPRYCNDHTSVRCTLTHGDYKKNNVLVREEDGEPVEVIPVDYQLIDYGCPFRDFMYFIFSGTDREFRRNHLNDLKELYFETLSKFLEYFNMDVENVYPRKDFDKVYTEWLDYGLMIALFGSITVFAPPTGLDLENVGVADLPYSPDKYYEHFLTDLIKDFVHWGYL